MSIGEASARVANDVPMGPASLSNKAVFRRRLGAILSGLDILDRKELLNAATQILACGSSAQNDLSSATEDDIRERLGQRAKELYATDPQALKNLDEIVRSIQIEILRK